MTSINPTALSLVFDVPEVAERLHALYAPFLRTDRPFLIMTPESAEMTKYVANCLLATKISFINEMANLCEGYGADVNDVRRGIGHDQRIGFHFLFPGVGYGGSCFPKDIRAVIHMAQSKGLPALMMEAVDAVNRPRRRYSSARSISISMASSKTRRSRSGAWLSSHGRMTFARHRHWC